MISQSLRPSKWVVVDDGSTDNSAVLIQEYASLYDWIIYLKFEDKDEKRSYGAKVVRVFNSGLKTIEGRDYDFIVKLDADLTLPPDYFEIISKTFLNNPKVGLCGGYCVYKKNGKEIIEKMASYHIRGAFKSIRRECWDDIGGFREVLGWDGLDEMEAMYKGWKTMNINLAIIHHRPTNSVYNSASDKIESAEAWGRISYLNGRNLFLATIRALVALKEKPFLIYSLVFLKGYLKALINMDTKNVSPELAKFINKFHFKRLVRLRRF